MPDMLVEEIQVWDVSRDFKYDTQQNLKEYKIRESSLRIKESFSY